MPRMTVQSYRCATCRETHPETEIQKDNGRCCTCGDTCLTEAGFVQVTYEPTIDDQGRPTCGRMLEVAPMGPPWQRPTLRYDGASRLSPGR